VLRVNATRIRAVGVGAGFTLIEMLVVITIIGILVGLTVPAIMSAMDSAVAAKARNDVIQLVAAVKAYETEYGKLPTDVVSSDDGAEASQGWFQEDNDRVVKVLIGENDNDLNPRLIVFLEPRQAKGTEGSFRDGLGTDKKLYDPWGTPYAIKLDTSYNNELEYYGGPTYKSNVRRSAFAVSFGKNKIQQDPGKAVDKDLKVDDIVSFR